MLRAGKSTQPGDELGAGFSYTHSVRLRTRIIAPLSILFSIGLAGCATQSERLRDLSALRATGSVVSTASTASASSTAPALVAPTSLRVPILVYHRIRVWDGPKDTWSAKMSVSPASFERQMQWLVDKGYTTISLDTYVDIRSGALPVPAKPVVVTFDDNDMTQYDIAFPIMKARGQIGVFYLVTNRLENPNVIEAIRAKEMADAGMDMQSHTITHRVLTALPVEEVDREFTESRRSLEALLGKPVRHVAYPGTAHNEMVREAAKRAGYATATIMDPRTSTASDDPYKLPRIMMLDDTDLEKLLP